MNYVRRFWIVPIFMGDPLEHETARRLVTTDIECFIPIYFDALVRLVDDAKNERLTPSVAAPNRFETSPKLPVFYNDYIRHTLPMSGRR